MRYSANPEQFKRFTTEETRKEFLIERLFVADHVSVTYSHVDRMCAFGIMPVTRPVPLDDGIDCWHNFGTDFILERREAGVFNVGGKGRITCDGQAYEMGYEDCLYITKGTREVVFESLDSAKPAKFYMASVPAHTAYTTTFIPMSKANHRPCGSSATANDRTINQFIHPDVLKTCQLSMGLTQLKVGSVWNTMPAHTHERRMELYFYFEVPEDQAVIHLMGQPQETRHLIIHNEQAVIGPSWSIHSGCGTSNYTFIWAMAGENLAFDDMDNIAIQDLR
ncbi:MAG: 5-dehydro-4-deoxy-D-glucuronate isomerase [Succinivibrionaceae bacterium]|nr:5-dehydro-4-deoxy-D-glucuronate isomerase [Succinivibrionaceae bacterium]